MPEGESVLHGDIAEARLLLRVAKLTRGVGCGGKGDARWSGLGERGGWLLSQMDGLAPCSMSYRLHGNAGVFLRTGELNLVGSAVTRVGKDMHGGPGRERGGFFRMGMFKGTYVDPCR
jgi:hypothetical protein